MNHSIYTLAKFVQFQNAALPNVFSDRHSKSHPVSFLALDCGVQYFKLVPVLNGVRVKIDSVQVCMVDAKEVDDFLKKKKAESDEQCNRIRSDIEKLQPETTDASQSYTNDPRYVAVIKESDDAIKKAQTLANSIAYLRSKYGESPFGRNPIVTKPPKVYLDAWHDEDIYTAQLQDIRHNASRIDAKIDSVLSEIKNENNLRRQNTAKKMNGAKESLKALQTPNFYLADFSPAALEMSLSDEKGCFVIHAPKPGTKIFVKVEPGTDNANEQFFWLVDLPPKDQKLILNTSNLFDPAKDFDSL